MPDVPGLESIRRAHFDAFLAKLVARRLLIAPAFSIVGGLTVAIDPDPWRVVTAVVAISAILVLSLVEYARMRAQRFGNEALPMNFLAMAAFQVVIVYLTGALQSPILPILVPLALVGGVLFGRSLELFALLVLQLGSLVVFAWGPLSGLLPDPRLAPLSSGELSASMLVTQAVLLFVILPVASGVGIVIRGQMESMIMKALTSQEAERQAHESHARELTALSGELAHELKNPLASIKGLAALLARDAEGRPAERLAVLRGEVERMQGIVQEFLDFTRPLVPLAMGPVDLVGLCTEVADLEEGHARLRSVTLEVESDGDVGAHCDRRKVRQVLVNLVLNAIAAAPQGTTVSLRTRVEGGNAEVVVADLGSGIPGDLRERVFEAGVTTREGGSGLGLTVARSLARQHGGELLLEPNTPCGTRAILRLPVAGSLPDSARVSA